MLQRLAVCACRFETRSPAGALKIYGNARGLDCKSESKKGGQKEGYFLIQGNKVIVSRNHYTFTLGKAYAR